MEDRVIGLKRHTVKLSADNETWRKIFDETKEELLVLLDKYQAEIEHVGSTSIEGIIAKPIIDIAIGIADISLINEVIPILEKKDHIFRGDVRENGGYLFVKEIEPEIITHHIHVVEKEDIQWKNYLYFRDKLNSDTNLSKQYEELKIELAEKFAEDRKSYTKGKNEFIKKILKGK